MSPIESIKMFVDYCRRTFQESRDGLKKMYAFEIVILACVIALSVILVATIIYAMKYIVYLVFILLTALFILVLASWIIKAISQDR